MMQRSLLAAAVGLSFLGASLAGGKKLQKLNDETFEHETQASTGSTTGSWLVVFGKKGCKKSKAARAAVQKIDEDLREEYIIPAYSLQEDSKGLWKRFDIYQVPMPILFHKGWFYRYDGEADADAILKW